LHVDRASLLLSLVLSIDTRRRKFLGVEEGRLIFVILSGLVGDDDDAFSIMNNDVSRVTCEQEDGNSGIMWLPKAMMIYLVTFARSYSK
jgi:hypothetical protein